jgi:hypothetical protein
VTDMTDKTTTTPSTLPTLPVLPTKEVSWVEMLLSREQEAALLSREAEFEFED